MPGCSSVVSLHFAILPVLFKLNSSWAVTSKSLLFPIPVLSWSSAQEVLDFWILYASLIPLCWLRRWNRSSVTLCIVLNHLFLLFSSIYLFSIKKILLLIFGSFHFSNIFIIIQISKIRGCEEQQADMEHSSKRWCVVERLKAREYSQKVPCHRWGEADSALMHQRGDALSL